MRILFFTFFSLALARGDNVNDMAKPQQLKENTREEDGVWYQRIVEEEMMTVL